MSKTLK